jgi:NTE family protein
MTRHWKARYQDAVRTLRHPEALERPGDRIGVTTFDLTGPINLQQRL